MSPSHTTIRWRTRSRTYVCWFRDVFRFNCSFGRVIIQYHSRFGYYTAVYEAQASVDVTIIVERRVAVTKKQRDGEK